jgi:hypothetical protein
MHLPECVDAPDRCCHLPWTDLHTTKGSVDMAAHLEAVPAARAGVTSTPARLAQIHGYAPMVVDLLDRRVAIRHPLLTALGGPELSTDPTFPVTFEGPDTGRWGVMRPGVAR